MLQPCTNPACSVQFAVGIAQCPACGAPALQPDVDPEPARRVWTVGQIVASVICTGVGILPGALWYANTGSNQAALIFGLGGFIGFALSLPGVSIVRVLTGTAAITVSRRAAGRMIRDALSPDSFPPDELPTDDRGRRG